MIIIYTTYPSLKEAKKIGKHLIEKGLVKCMNLFPVESCYIWKGKMENAKEVVAILKAPEKNWGKIKKEIESIHSYETPCIIKIKSEANEKFEKWVNN